MDDADTDVMPADMSVEMLGWVNDLLFLLAATVIALCGIAVVAICSLCVEAFRQVSAATGPRRHRTAGAARPHRAWTTFVRSRLRSETPAGPSAQ